MTDFYRIVNEHARVRGVLFRRRAELMALPGVVGVGLSIRSLSDARPGIAIWLSSADFEAGIPAEIDGVWIACAVVGTVQAGGTEGQ